MVEAFIDESWLTGQEGDDYFLAVVSVITADRRGLELTIRRIRRVPKLKAKSELKAWSSPSEVIKRFLNSLADDPSISIIVIVWQAKKSEIEDYEQLYQDLIAECAFQTVRRQKRIDLFIDKRYTNKKQQQELEGAIRERLVVIPNNIVRIFQEDSQRVRELTAPDFVAWAFMQSYCRANDEYRKIVRSRVVHFQDLSQKKKAAHPRHR